MAEVTKVHAPQENVNDATITILQWIVSDGQFVKENEVLVEAETSKAAFSVEAPCDGYVKILASQGQDVPIGEPLCLISSSQDAVQSDTTGDKSSGDSEEKTLAGTRFSAKAEALLEQYGLSKDIFKNFGLVKEKDVLQHVKGQAGAATKEIEVPHRVHDHDAPADLLSKWQILDPTESDANKPWLVYSKEFIGRIISGGYGSQHEMSTAKRILASIVMVCVAIAQGVIWFLTKIPFVKSWIEILARVYRRNPFGFFLRGAYYKAILGGMGQDNIIDQNVEIWGGKNVFIGKGCHLDMYARLAAGESGQGQKGSIEIGDHVHIGPQCQLAGRGGIKIGCYTAITAGTKIFSATNVGENPDNPYDLLPMSHAAPLDRQRIYESAVEIGHHVFVGLNVCVLPGVKIGNGAIVNSGTVVTRSVPDYAIVSGNPSKITGYRTPRPQKDDKNSQFLN